MLAGGRAEGEARLSKVETLSYLFRALCRFAKSGREKTLVMDFQLRGSIHGSMNNVGRNREAILLYLRDETRIWNYR